MTDKRAIAESPEQHDEFGPVVVQFVLDCSIELLVRRRSDGAEVRADALWGMGENSSPIPGLQPTFLGRLVRLQSARGTPPGVIADIERILQEFQRMYPGMDLWVRPPGYGTELIVRTTPLDEYGRPVPMISPLQGLDICWAMAEGLLDPIRIHKMRGESFVDGRPPTIFLRIFPPVMFWSPAVVRGILEVAWDGLDKLFRTNSPYRANLPDVQVWEIVNTGDLPQRVKETSVLVSWGIAE